MNINNAHELKMNIDNTHITCIHYDTIVKACDKETAALEIRFEFYNIPFELCDRIIKASGITRNSALQLDYNDEALFADIYSDDNGLTLRIY